MITLLTCKTCGLSLSGSRHDGYCAACMLREALGESDDLTMVEPPPPGLPRMFGAYELVEEIARGGMGVVYKARQVNLNRTVALKLLIGGAYSSESLQRRFQVEAEAAAALQHPGIVAIHEFGEVEHQPYYTMDYVAGRNLAQVVAGVPLAPERAARYLQAIAEAVAFAHKQGILHRDLKPSNVLVDQDDRPRVADFGLAKRLHEDSSVTLAGEMMGSPNYAPPEQVAGRQAEVGVTSDVYSLGGLLYNLLTGRPPFLAGTVRETLRLVFEAEPVAPRTLNPAIPRDLETICLKCLEKDRTRRYPSAQALVDELARFRRGEPIHARPISPPEQFFRWCHRHPAIASLAATIVIALAGTSAIFYTSARRIERARGEEHVARELAEESHYAAAMQVMSRVLTSVTGTHLQGAETNIDAPRPKPGQRDLRGFEWRYFWRKHQSNNLARLQGHRHVVKSASFSPDGRRIATRSYDETLKIWDAATAKELLSVDHVAAVGGFSADSAQFTFGGSDHSIWRLDIASHQAAQISSASGRLIAVHPDGRHAVVLNADDIPVLHLLDVNVPRPRAAANRPSKTIAVVSADASRAAVARPPRLGILVLDLATGQTIATLDDPRPVTALALSPDGKTVVSASFNGYLKIWDVARGVEVQTFRPFVDPILALAFAADGGSLAGGGSNNHVKIWDTSSWDEIEMLTGHASTVECVAFAPGGERLVSGGMDEVALVWPSRVNSLQEEMPQLLRGPEWKDPTAAIAFSPDSALFVGTAADGTVKVWRTDTIEATATIPTGDARNVSFAPDGKSVLTESYDGLIQRWTLGGQVLDRFGKPKTHFANWQIDPLTPQERVVLVADQAETRAKCGLCNIPSARDGLMNSGPGTTMVTSPDGRTVYMGSSNGEVEIWDVEKREARIPAFAAHKLPVTAIAVSGDGRYFATGSLDNTTRLWDAVTGRAVAIFHGHNRPVWALAFSPDGQTLAAGSCDKEIILCNIPLRRNVASLPLYVGIPKGYEQEVRFLRFSPDSNILAAGLGDGTLRFFRAAPFSETDRPITPRL